jgi:hypothetical protein
MKGSNFEDDPIGQQMGQASLAEAAAVGDELVLVDVTPYLEEDDA